MSPQNYSTEEIEQIESIISLDRPQKGLNPTFSTRDIVRIDPAYNAIKNAPIHTAERFAGSSCRIYSFFKARNENIYIVETYMGEIDRVFKYSTLF